MPTIYKALRILRDQGVSLHHTHIGGGEDREKIISLIKDLDLGSVTRLLGTQPHQVVLEHYKNADLFVLGCEVAPNGDRDGIPNVLVESMAMGLPVVATDISAIPELVENEKPVFWCLPATGQTGRGHAADADRHGIKKPGHSGGQTARGAGF